VPHRGLARDGQRKWTTRILSRALERNAEGVRLEPCKANRTDESGLPCGQLPYSMKVLLEEPAAQRGRQLGQKADIQAVANWLNDKGKAGYEIAYRPARVLMQDFTGVPAVVDLAAMRDAMVALGGDPQKINPLVPVDLVIDHSVIVDEFGTPRPSPTTSSIEYERNGERYRFLKWGQQAFDNFRVVPPGTGICHQVNLEYLGQTVWTKDDQTARPSPIPTPASAPTATPP
jgi:aconitate hydratase